MCLGLANGYKEPKEMTPQKAIKILNETIVIIDEKCKTTPKEYHKMLVMAEKALEKQIPINHFKNECSCIVDYELLYKAINNKCKSENCYFHNVYRIVLKNGYPAVCINRKWFYVHILICECVNGGIRKGYIVHHKDKNKLNALLDNLELMTNLKHSKLHGMDRKGIDFRSEEGKANSINSAREVRTRKDVTIEKVVELRNKGLTIPEIAKELNCGINTINRRLGMKDY